MGINYAPIINWINKLSEKVFCSENEKTVTQIYLRTCSLKKATSATVQNLLKLITVDKIRYLAVQFIKISG